MMNPIRKIQQAKAFKVDTNAEQDELMLPCSLRDPSAIEMSWTEVPAEKLSAPIVGYSDFLAGLESVNATVNPAELDKYVAFTEEFGQQGWDKEQEQD